MSHSRCPIAKVYGNEMMCKEGRSRAILFVAMSGLLMVGYVGYLFAVGSPSPPSGFTGTSASGTYDDDGTTVYGNTYVAYNYVWDANLKYIGRTYHWARNAGLPTEAQNWTVEFRHRPGGAGWLAGSAAEQPFLKTDVNNNEYGDQDSNSLYWEKDAVYTSYRDDPGPAGYQWSNYTEIRFDGGQVSEASQTWTLPEH